MAEATQYDFDMGLEDDFKFINPDISGGPQVVYGGTSFTGSELDLVETDYGLLATIIIHVAPDRYVKRLTVLIPPVNFPGDIGGAYVTSQAIISTQHTTIAGTAAVSGQVISYEAKFIAGAASVGSQS
jgi:hypothetical protein